MAGKFYYDRKKKLVVCLAGARLLFRVEKKKFKSSVWRVRDWYYERKIKSSSRLSGGCAIVITSGKKKFKLLSSGCAIAITTGKKVLVGARLLLFLPQSDLREIIQFLREIECIEFECNKFVFVLFNN